MNEKLLKIAGLIIGIIASIATIYGVIRNQPSIVHNITSNNQKGGITADTVNINQTLPRHLNDGIINSLIQKLPNNKSTQIEISSVWGDQEAFNFATEIDNFLKNTGWNNIDGVNQSTYNRPVIGQIIQKESNGKIDIIIGANQQQ